MFEYEDELQFEIKALKAENAKLKRKVHSTISIRKLLKALTKGINKEFETYAYLPDLEDHIKNFKIRKKNTFHKISFSKRKSKCYVGFGMLK